MDWTPQPMSRGQRIVKMYKFKINRKDGNSFVVEAHSSMSAQGRACHLISGLHGRHANRSKKWKAARDMIESIECIGLVGDITVTSYKDGVETKTTYPAPKKLSISEQLILQLTGIDELVKCGLMSESEKEVEIKKVKEWYDKMKPR